MADRSGKPDGNGDDKKSTVRAWNSVIEWKELELWQQDNQFIHTGYRAASGSITRSFASLGHLHNETVNIYSHLLAAFGTVITGWLVHVQIEPRLGYASSADIFVFGCFFAGAAACLATSAVYHTLSNHSARVQRIGNRLDYLGIVGLIWGCTVPTVYYGFRDNPDLVWRYWSMISTLGAGCAVVCLSDRFRSPKWRPFRASMFAAMGLSGIVPIVHAITIYSRPELELRIGLSWLLSQGGLNLLGAAMYALRVPERLRPGAFDLFGSSHQFLHILVVCAAIAHLRGLLIAFDHHYERGSLADLPHIRILSNVGLFSSLAGQKTT